MEIKEYLNVKNYLSNQIGKLNKELIENDVEFIKDNKEFDFGEKVKIETDKGNYEAFVSNIAIHDDGTIFYGLKSVRKDGTMSNQGFNRTNFKWFKIHKL